MSRTRKDKANHFLHHTKINDSRIVYHGDSKRRYTEDQVPADVKPMMEKLGYDYNTGHRLGNNRKSAAKSKTQDRRIARAKDGATFRREMRDQDG